MSREAGDPLGPDCQHKTNEDCMVCCDCHKCSESLNEDDVCSECADAGCNCGKNCERCPGDPCGGSLIVRLTVNSNLSNYQRTLEFEVKVADWGCDSIEDLLAYINSGDNDWGDFLDEKARGLIGFEYYFQVAD